MGNFALHKAAEKFEMLKQLLIQGEEFGIDASRLVSKIDSVISLMNSQTIKIVLLGSFSDGKTSAIAGLLGQLKENMKIDQDESSDELAVYHFDGISNVEIIDTPGLFGTKEKEVDGSNIKYSDITKRYISEANIVVYVCDAVTPLKESHVEIIRRVLRDYGKLKSTIFVLNKMDEAGFDLLDPEDYDRGSAIKREALIRRLQETMDLTDEEAKQLNIVCIAADPKGKGLEHWFSKMDSYRERSHIGQLQETITDIVESSDVEELKSDTNLSVITDVVSDAREQLSTIILPVEKAAQNAQAYNAELIQDSSGLRRELIAAKGRLLEDLQTLSSSINTDIDEADQESIASLVENKLGLVDGQLDYHILDSKIEQTISLCVESNNYAITTKIEEFSQKVNIQENILKDALKGGAGKLKDVKLNNQHILNARNFLAQYFEWARKIKFKPHGAGKLAGKISKGAGIAGALIGVGVDLYDYFKEKKEAKKLHEFKTSLKSDISEKFRDLFVILNNEDLYFQEFAPSYLELCKAVKQRNAELAILQNQIQVLRQYNEQINDWLLNGQKKLNQ